MPADLKTSIDFPLMSPDLPREADVVVVGAGVVGLCSALYLAEAGRKVVLIERSRVAGLTSEGNACLVSPSHSVPFPAISAIRDGLRWMVDPASPFFVRPTLSWNRLSWLLRFAQASAPKHVKAGSAVLSELLLRSADLYERDIERHATLDPAFRRNGILNIHETPESLQRGIDEARFLEEFGLFGELIDGPEVPTREPTISAPVAGAILWPQDGQIDPALYTSQMADLLTELGVDIFWSTELLSLKMDRGRVRTLQTTAGEIEVDELVLAAGAWSPRLAAQLGLRLPVQPGKGYSVTAPTRGPLPRQPILFVDAKVVASPLADRLRLAGTLELVGDDMGISRRRVEALQKVAGRMLARAEIEPGGRVWRGLRPLSPDGLPVIGRTAGVDNVALATGHGHLGLSLAPITGQLIAELLAGDRPSVDLAPVSPDRFRTKRRPARIPA